MSNRRHASWTLILVALPLVLAGCPEDKNDPKTWIKKLGSPKTVDRALEQLGYLQDPVAIPALGDTWKEYNHDTRVLRYVISMANQWDEGEPTVEQVCRKAYTTDEKKCADYKTLVEERKQGMYGKKYANGPYWDYKGGAAFNIIIAAANLFIKDKFSKTAMNNAEAAVEAMRTAKLTYDKLRAKPDSKFDKELPGKVVETLVQILSETNDIDRKHPGQKVRLVVCRALGEFDSPEAVDALIGVLNKADNPKSQHPKIFAAAADALSKIAVKNQKIAAKSVDALLLTMFAVPDVYQFTRRALVALGDHAQLALMQVFEHRHKAVNLFAKNNKFADRCYGDGGEEYGYKSDCKAPSNLRYKAAMVLGDMHSKKALPMLLNALHDRPVPAFFDPKGRSLPPTQHSAILEAIQKIASGDRKVSEKIKACWLGGPLAICNKCMVNGKRGKCAKNFFPKRTHCRCYSQNHAASLNTYSFIAGTPGKGVLGELTKYIKGNFAPALRFDSGISYGRLAKKGNSIEPLAFMIVGNRKKANAQKKLLDPAKKKLKAAKAVEKKERKKLKGLDRKDVKQEKRLTTQLETLKGVVEMEKTLEAKLKKAKKTKKPQKQLDLIVKQLEGAKKAAAKVRSDGAIAKIAKKLRPLKKTVTPFRLAVEKAEKNTKAASSAVKKIERTFADLTNFQRTFEYALARAAVGMKCGSDVKCYMSFIKKRRSKKVSKMIAEVIKSEKGIWRGKKGKAAAANVKALGDVTQMPKQVAKWKLTDRKALTMAVAERSALEIAKLGKKAKGSQGDLLKLLKTKDPFVRQALLIALLHVADKPCKDCVKRLDVLIERDSKSAAAVRLATEAKLWRSYFSWAK